MWLTSLISFKFVWGDSVLKNVDAARKSLVTVSEAHRRGGGTQFETQRTLHPTMIKIEPQCAGCPRRPGQETTAPDSHVQGSWRGWFWSSLHGRGSCFGHPVCCEGMQEENEEEELQVEVEQLARLRHVGLHACDSSRQCNPPGTLTWSVCSPTMSN